MEQAYGFGGEQESIAAGTGLFPLKCILDGASLSNGTGMNVSITAGVFFYDGTIEVHDTDLTVAISAADGSNPRIDYVTYSFATSDFNVIAGTPAEPPEPPTLPLNQVLIGEVYVDTSVTDITADDVYGKNYDGYTPPDRGIVYVDADNGTDYGTNAWAGRGRTWETAFDNIADAITAASAGDTIVFRGTASSASTLVVSKNLSIVGVGPDNSILEYTGTGSAVEFDTLNIPIRQRYANFRVRLTNASPTAAFESSNINMRECLFDNIIFESTNAAEVMFEWSSTLNSVVNDILWRGIRTVAPDYDHFLRFPSTGGVDIRSSMIDSCFLEVNRSHFTTQGGVGLLERSTITNSHFLLYGTGGVGDRFIDGSITEDIFTGCVFEIVAGNADIDYAFDIDETGNVFGDCILRAKRRRPQHSHLRRPCQPNVESLRRQLLAPRRQTQQKNRGANTTLNGRKQSTLPPRSVANTQSCSWTAPQRRSLSPSPTSATTKASRISSSSSTAKPTPTPSPAADQTTSKKPTAHQERRSPLTQKGHQSV